MRLLLMGFRDVLPGCQLAGPAGTCPTLVHGGRQRFTRKGIRVLMWNTAADAADP